MQHEHGRGANAPGIYVHDTRAADRGRLLPGRGIYGHDNARLSCCRECLSGAMYGLWTGFGVLGDKLKENHKMRLKTEAYKEIMREKGLTTDQICKSTGLSEFSLNWILDNGGFTSDGTLKALAVAAGVELKGIVRPDPSDNVENGIEFIKDAKTATVQFCQGRYKSRIKKLAAERPDECGILAENKDGTLLAHIPVEWVKIIPPRQLSDEQKKEIAERLSRTR